MNKNQDPCINLTDAYTPLAVWRFGWEGWQLIKVERPKIAIALTQPPLTLAFPTSVLPDELEKRLKNSLNKRKFLQKYSFADLVAVGSCQ